MASTVKNWFRLFFLNFLLLIFFNNSNWFDANPVAKKGNSLNHKHFEYSTFLGLLIFFVAVVRGIKINYSLSNGDYFWWRYHHIMQTDAFWDKKKGRWMSLIPVCFQTKKNLSVTQKEQNFQKMFLIEFSRHLWISGNKMLNLCSLLEGMRFFRCLFPIISLTLLHRHTHSIRANVIRWKC